MHFLLDSRLYPFLNPSGPVDPFVAIALYKKMKNVSCEYDRLKG